MPLINVGKPHVSKWGTVWLCRGAALKQLGRTPAEAYTAWVKALERCHTGRRLRK